MLYNVFVQRRVGEKVEVTVAKRAEQRGAGEAQQAFVLYDGEQYEGVPGTGRFRISRFAELGYPIRLPTLDNWTRRVEARPTTDLVFSAVPAERTEFERRLAGPLMALILAIFAVPLARLRPRQGRYAKMGFALLAYFLYQIGIATGSVWIEKQTVPLFVGLWWVHIAALGFAAWLVLRQDPLRAPNAATTLTESKS
jgi:lipopolysaccharide export system permease protein